MTNKGRSSSVIFLCILFSISLGKAQSQEVDFQTWSDFTITYNIKNKSNISADVGIRGLISRNEWNQIYIRPTYKYYFNTFFQVSGGVAYFGTISDEFRNTNEFRLFQEASITWPSLEILTFQHRLRFEERFFKYEESSSFVADIPDAFEARARYQISLESSDIHFGDGNRPIYFLTGWELFYALNETAIEQFINNQRILGGFGHRISPRFKYEIQYIFQKSRKYIDEGLQTSEHLLRFRFYWQPNSPKRSAI